MSTNHDIDFATGGAISSNGNGIGLMLPALCTGTQFSITGTWVGTLTLQASYDNATWVNIADVATNTAYTANKTGLVRTSPYQFFQIIATAWTSGTANIKLQPVSNLAPVTSGGGGGGGPAVITDPTTATNQAAVLAPGGSGSFALSVQGVTGGTLLPVSVPGNVNVSATSTIPVTGTFWQAVQPISAVSLPLPSGASTAAKQPALGTAGTASTDVISVQGIASMTALKTDGSGVTQPVSAASLPLPSGAATAAKQPALGTAGSASTDVITVQGIASGTAQPISAASLPLPTGASTAAKQPALGTSGTPSTDVLTVQGAASMTALSVSEFIGGTVISATNPMPTTAGQFARTDKSGTITSGGTAQNAFAAAAAVHGFYFMNISTVAMWIRDDGTAATAGSGSILIPPNGGYYESPPLSTPTSALSVFCATTASAFTCKVW